MKNNKLKSLVKLLEDEDSNTVTQAMAELLSMDKKIDSVISVLQESSTGKIRRHAHQMQAVKKYRDKRTSFAAKLKNSDTDLLEGFAEIHLQWFDQDDIGEIYKSCGEFLSTTSEWLPDSLEKIGKMMTEMGFKTPDAEEFFPEYFCIGAIIDETLGADFILCSIAKLAGEFHGFNTKIVNTPLGFGLCDSEGMMLFPSKDWMTCIVKNHSNFETWTNSMVLRQTASMLFLSLMTMQNFRYAYSIGKCLLDSGNDDISKILSYPFGEK
jgi:hypothetical protein